MRVSFLAPPVAVSSVCIFLFKLIFTREVDEDVVGIGMVNGKKGSRLSRFLGVVFPLHLRWPEMSLAGDDVARSGP